MISSAPFKVEDCEKFTSKRQFQNFEKQMEINTYDISKIIKSLWRKDCCIAILGVNILRVGVGELWLLPGVEIDECPYGFFKAVKKEIYEYCFKELGFHRLEILIEKGWVKGKKWAETLGFKFEGIREAYDAEFNDYEVYYKVVR